MYSWRRATSGATRPFFWSDCEYQVVYTKRRDPFLMFIDHFYCARLRYSFNRPELGGQTLKRILFSCAGLLLAVTAAMPAFAGPGVHLGASVNPDDFLIGLRFRSHPIAEAIYVVPNAEVGFGDVTQIAGNLDAYYSFKTSSELRPYAGGGLTLTWYDFDGGSDTQFGGSILGGIYVKPAVFFEAKLGLGDTPDWKFIVGWNK
jgi:hypothetical protein